MTKILYAINVFDRFEDLKIQTEMIRHQLPNAVISIFCNCDKALVEKAKEAKYDHFIWKENTGHGQGTIDAYNYIAEISNNEDFDYVISAHAKSWLTDYSVVEKIISNMESQNKSLGFFDLYGYGSMCDKKYMGHWLDLFFIRKDLVSKIFPMKYDSETWPETEVYDHINVNLQLADHVYNISHKRFRGCDKCNGWFENVNDSNAMLLCQYSIDEKLKKLGEANKELKKIIEDIGYKCQ